MLKDYFAGYQSPSYEVTSVTGVTAEEQNGMLTVKPSEASAKLFVVKVKASEGGISLERKFHFAYGNGTSGIQTITKNDTKGVMPFYDLMGRKIDEPVQGGLYIQNGKKVVVR